MKLITATTLKKQLSEKTDKELVDEILDLFKNIPKVKDYYTAKYSGEDAIIEKYRDIITNEFFPKRGYGKLKLSVARKAINDFKKLSESKEHLVDLMLHYVEQGVRFTDEYGDIDENFYCSMEGMFESTMKLISKNGFIPMFKERCLCAIDKACDGWGFKESLQDIYKEFDSEDVK